MKGYVIGSMFGLASLTGIFIACSDDQEQTSLSSAREIVAKKQCYKKTKWLVQCRPYRHEMVSTNDLLVGNVCSAPQLIVNADEDALLSDPEGNENCLLPAGSVYDLSKVTATDAAGMQRLVTLKESPESCGINTGYILFNEVSIEFNTGKSLGMYEKFPLDFKPGSRYSYPSQVKYPRELLFNCEQGIDYEDSCVRGKYFTPDTSTSYPRNCGGYSPANKPNEESRPICLRKRPTYRTGCHESDIVKRKPGVRIPDTGTITQSIDFSQEIEGNLAVKLSLDINHSYAPDLQITLVSPKGTFYSVIKNPRNLSSTISGSYHFPLSAKETTRGSWELRVRDSSQDDSGVLNSWSLQFIHKSW